MTDHLLSTGRLLEAFHSDEEFEFQKPEPASCRYASHFSEWIKWLYDQIVGESPDIITVNQAKLLLQDQYFLWRDSVNMNHRDKLGSRGHVCIYQVYVEAHKRLRLTELSLRPAILFKLPKQLAPAEPPGTLIGLEEWS